MSPLMGDCGGPGVRSGLLGIGEVADELRRRRCSLKSGRSSLIEIGVEGATAKRAGKGDVGTRPLWRSRRETASGITGFCVGVGCSSESESDSPSSRFRRNDDRRIVEFQWFFTALSVRPGRSFAISAHLFPILPWRSWMEASSSSVQGDLLIPG